MENPKGYIPFVRSWMTIILANGAFPEHIIPLNILNTANHIICCDGAAEQLLNYGLEPHFIVGDLDSLHPEIKDKYRDRTYSDRNQETNDLTKAVLFCKKQDLKDITILGATGKREDHSIANISLLTDFSCHVNVQMVTDHGVFFPISRTTRFMSYPGQQVSVFSLTPETEFTLTGLRYPLKNKKLASWWQGSLNEACNNTFIIEMNEGKAIVFREHSK